MRRCPCFVGRSLHLPYGRGRQKVAFCKKTPKGATAAHGCACGSCLTGCGSRIARRALGRRLRSATAAPASPRCIRRRRRSAPQPFGFPFDKISRQIAHLSLRSSYTICRKISLLVSLSSAHVRRQRRIINFQESVSCGRSRTNPVLLSPKSHPVRFSLEFLWSFLCKERTRPAPRQVIFSARCTR